MATETVEVDGTEVAVTVTDDTASAEVVPEVPHELEEAVSIWDEVEPATVVGGDYKVWFDTDECNSRNFDHYRDNENITLKYIGFEPSPYILVDYDE